MALTDAQTVNHVTVIVNPNSRQGAGRHVAALAADALRKSGTAHDVAICVDAEETSERASKAARSGTDAIVVVGGDGTLRLTLEASFGSGKPIGLIPAGHGNDFARHLSIPLDDVSRAVGIITAGHRRRVDLGRVTFPDGHTALFASVAATGFDAAVATRAMRMSWPHGQHRFTVAAMRELSRLRTHHYHVRVDDDRTEDDLAFVAIGNATSYGGGMRITPNASISDGYLDVTVASLPGRHARLRFARAFPQVFSGRHVTNPLVQTRRGREIELYCDPPAPVSLDGDPVGCLPAVFEVVPSAVEILAQPSQSA